MKTLLATIAACTFFLVAGAQTTPAHAPDEPSGEVKQEPHGKYCVVMKDGVRKVMIDGMVLTAEVVLSDSTRLTPDGTVVRADGARAVLKVGECVGKNGSFELNRNLKREEE